MAKIVVVEDESLILMVVVDLLEELGHEVVDFVNAETALNYIGKGNQFDILMTDMNLPKMSGRELAEQLRELTPDLPVIFATGYVIGRDDRLSAPFSCVSKPYWSDNLKTAIGEVWTK